MAAEIVENDNVAWLEGRDQELFDIGQETPAVDGTVDDRRSVDPVMAKRGEEGQRLPMTVRDLGAQPFTPATATMGARHIGLGPGLVDEDEAPGIKPSLITLPACAPTRHVAPILFGRQHGFF
jgi:hypothetical protein